MDLQAFRPLPACKPGEGSVVLLRPLTYAECLAAGCSEQQALDYFKAAGPAQVRRIPE
jgi:hypothetical protein